MDAASKVLHVALQTDITGYVAMSWPSRFGYMAPADGIIGFMGKGDGAPSVQAYTLEVGTGRSGRVTLCVRSRR